jgi:hypothetical protein
MIKFLFRYWRSTDVSLYPKRPFLGMYDAHRKATSMDCIVLYNTEYRILSISNEYFFNELKRSVSAQNKMTTKNFQLCFHLMYFERITVNSRKLLITSCRVLSRGSPYRQFTVKKNCPFPLQISFSESSILIFHSSTILATTAWLNKTWKRCFVGFCTSTMAVILLGHLQIYFLLNFVPPELLVHNSSYA